MHSINASVCHYKLLAISSLTRSNRSVGQVVVPTPRMEPLEISDACCQEPSSSRDLMSAEKESLLRKQIAESLKKKLLQVRVGDEEVEDDNKLKASISRMAASLETILLAQANKSSSTDTTATTTTSRNPQDVMNKSLQTLVHALQSRRQKRRHPKNSRWEFLRKMLGPKKYGMVKHLVEQIKLARLVKAGEGCSSCRRMEDGTLVCPRPQQRQQQQQLGKNDTATTNRKQRQFPSAVQSLFFEVELMHALEFKSLQTWRDMDWDELIQQAQDILRSYQQWRAASLTIP